ncbi:CHRD domain-containing protein [Isoptericola hypogeus]|uniref:CHRD domain-containing protein n=1 Tax=Isoptericola hypogeus TaxID=300179 RepID=A0ABN2ITU9_9MICO
MERRRVKAAAAVVTGLAVAASLGTFASADNGRGSPNRVSERLSGYEETPLSLSTAGNGRFEARIDTRDEEIRWTLSFADTETTVTQAHIHFGSPSQSGGIAVFLCTNLGNGPAGTQACPAEGTVRGTIVPADVIGPAGQGLAVGDFDALVDAVRAESTYVNVHTTGFPAGEIRGHIDH